jgi:hypothetical protein
MQKLRMITRRWLIVAAGLILATAVAWCLVPRTPADPEEALIAYFYHHGIVLKRAPVLTGWWRVESPRLSAHAWVEVAVKAFPPEATEAEMNSVVMATNLAMILNAPGHIAMSYPGVGSEDPVPLSAQDEREAEATRERMLLLFRGYRPRKPWWL